MFRWTLTNPTTGSSVLNSDPYGWESAEFNIRRDKKYHGLFNTFSLELEFACDSGKEFIDEVYDREGIDGDISILIEFECSDGSGFETLYDGKLNFGTYEDTVTGKGEPITRINIEQSDVTQLIKTRDKIKIDLATTTSLDGNSIGASYTYQDYSLNLHSQKIFLESHLDYPSYPQTESTTNSLTNSISYGCFEQHAFPLVKSELESTIANPDVTDLRTGGAFAIASSYIQHFHTADMNRMLAYPATYDLTYSFAGTYYDIEGTGQTRVLSGTWSLLLYYGETLTKAVALGQVVNMGSIAGYSTSSTSYSTTFSFSGSTTISLEFGDKIWLAWGITGGTGYSVTTGPFTGNVTWQWDYTDADLNISIDSTYPETTCQAYAIHEAWARIVGAITDQSDPVRSTLFGRTNSSPHSYASNGCDSFGAITSGLAIRGFSASEKPVVVSMSDMFEACNSIWNLGIGIESGGSGEVVRIEKKSYFYDTTTLIQLQNVSGLRMKVDDSYYYNEANIGFSKWESEEVQGLDEISTRQQWYLPINATQQTLEAMSKFIASGYGIEVTRRLGTTGQDTTDWKYDNDVFVICLKRGVDGNGDPDELDETETDENYSAVSGITNSDTRYNLRISPKRNLLRWMYFLNAGLTKKPGENILFQEGVGNFGMSSTMTANSCDGDFSGASLDEDADMAWDNANIRTSDPVWLPEIYEFDYPITHTEFQTILANPERAIEFSGSYSDFKKGFILEMSYKIATGEARFMLLRANA